VFLVLFAHLLAIAETEVKDEEQDDVEDETVAKVLLCSSSTPSEEGEGDGS
jgi:hypothetical protein